MLDWAGKLSSIGEILTIKLAELLGALHMNDLLSFSVSFQLAGTVHDIPCRSHFASFPPAIAAACAGVATPFSALPPPPELELDPEFEPDDDFPCLNFSERLQHDNAETRTSPIGMYFIIRTPRSDVKASRFYRKRRSKSMAGIHGY